MQSHHLTLQHLTLEKQNRNFVTGGFFFTYCIADSASTVTKNAYHFVHIREGDEWQTAFNTNAFWPH